MQWPGLKLSQKAPLKSLEVDDYWFGLQWGCWPEQLAVGLSVWPGLPPIIVAEFQDCVLQEDKAEVVWLLVT